MSTKKFGIVAGIVFALSVVVSPAFAACSLTDMSGCDNNGLMALIAQLLSGQQTQTTTSTTTTGSYAGIPAGFQFATNLKQGVTGNDVKYLQILLNADSATSIGNAGKETTYFGSMTKAAVVKFQNKYASEVLTPYGLTTGTGFFGTSTRAKANAMLGSTTTTTTTGGTTTTTTTTPVTGLNVALSSSNPAAASMAKGAVATPVVVYKISSQNATTLDSVKFTRTGLGAASDYNNTYIYSNGTRLKSGRAISSENNTVEFTNIGLAIPANGSVDLTLAVDVYTSAVTGDVNVMGIASASDIKFTAGTPSGSFPMNGNAMTISAVSIGTATIAAGSVPSSPSIGATGATVGEMKITTGSDDVTLNKVTFTQNGTTSSTNLKNITLKYDTTVLATTAAMTGDTVTLTLTTPYTIGKNKNLTFTITADIVGGKTSDSIRFYIDETSDIVIIDTKYNQGATVTNNFGSSQSSYVSALTGGEITITDKGPAANTVARNKTDVELVRFGVNTSRNVTVKDYNLTLNDGSDKANTTVAAASNGVTYTIGTSASMTVASASGFEVDDYIMVGTTTYAPTTDMIAKITNIAGAVLTITPVQGTNLTVATADIVSTVTKITAIRLVNVDTGSVIYSSSADRYFYNGASAVNVAASDDFDMNIGTSYTFAIKVDISEYATPDMEILGGFELNTASDVKDYDANEYVLAANIVPNTITGKTMTIGAASLSVTRASTPVSTTKVKGTQDVDLLGLSVNAGSTGDVKISQVIVRVQADADGTYTAGVGDTAANTVVDSISLYDESGKIAGPKSLASASWVSNTSGYYKATFDGLSYTVPAGASKKFTVKVNLKSTLSSNVHLSANLAPSTDITVKDVDGNVMTLADDSTNGGLNENDSNATVGNDDTPVVDITVSTGGSLALKAEGSPSSAIIAAGATNVVMSKYKLTATNEAYVLDKLSIASDTGTTDFATAESTNDNNITQVGIRINGGTPIKANLSSGVANFSNLNTTIAADGYIYVEVLADFNTIAAGATTGATPRLGIYQIQNANNTFRAVGQGSSTVANYTTTLNTTVTGEENVYAMTVRKTMPTVAKATGLATTLSNGTNTLYAFNVAADSHEAVALKRFKLVVTGSNADLVASALKLYRGTTDITDKVTIYDSVLGTVEGATDLINATTAKSVYFVWDGSTEEVVPAGQTYTYTVYATVSGTVSNYSIISYIADDTTPLTTTTGILAVGGWNATDSTLYGDAAGTAVVAGDIRVSAVDSYAAVNSGTAAVDGTTVLSKYGADEVDAAPLFTYTAGTTTWAYTSGEAGWTVTSAPAAGTFTATHTDGRVLVASGITAADGTNVVVTVTRTDNGYTAGSVVGASDSDIGLTLNAASTTHNFVWSDNSVTSHAVTAGSDWTNGYLVDSLATSSLAITAP